MQRRHKSAFVRAQGGQQNTENVLLKHYVCREVRSDGIRLALRGND